MCNEVKDVIVIQGSMTDSPNTNLVLAILRRASVTYKVSCASCHWHAGEKFQQFLDGIEEKIICFIGGMSLAAPGLISAALRNAKRFNKIVIAIPTDKHARSAIEVLPLGTWLLTPGLNEINPEHSIQNGALAIANLVAMRDSKVAKFLGLLHDEMVGKKPLIPEIDLDEKGLIPTKKEGI